MTANRTAKRLLAIAGTTALLVVPWSSAVADNGNSNDKQTICHATASDTNPYRVETPNKNGDVSGHADHTGPVWHPGLKADKDWWGDIIPPFDYNDHGTAGHFDGLNWTANGQAWWANACRVPITATVDKTNDADADSTFTDDETATSEAADVTFSVTVTNTSVVAAEVTSLVDAVAGTPVDVTPSPDPVGSTLAPGASVTFTFTLVGYSPADGEAKVNDLTVGLAQVGEPTNDATAHDTSTVRTAVPPPPAPDVSVLKSGPATAAPSDDLTWTLVATNTGTVPASGVTLTDTLPTGTTLVSVGGTGWTCSGTTDLTCTLDADLAVGASATVTVVATLAADFAGTTVSNTAVVTPDDATPTDNTSTVITDVITGGGGGGGGGGDFTGGGGGVTLPRTGSPLQLLAAAAVATMLLGFAMVLLVPRRTTR